MMTVRARSFDFAQAGSSSRRRATSVVRELTSRYGITANHLDAFGCGLDAPVASNDADGRAKNRRVELVQW